MGEPSPEPSPEPDLGAEEGDGDGEGKGEGDGVDGGGAEKGGAPWAWGWGIGVDAEPDWIHVEIGVTLFGSLGSLACTSTTVSCRDCRGLFKKGVAMVWVKRVDSRMNDNILRFRVESERV